MGKIFLEHMGGQKLYNCARCRANLTNRNELISKKFTGATGRAYLFGKVVNITFGEIQQRDMITGRHFVRDVYCKNCTIKLGWIYEYAVEEKERYKEGKTILERALIAEEKGLDNEI